MHTLIGIALALLGWGEPDIVYAQVEEPKIVLIEEKIDWHEERIKQEVKTQAEKYNVSYEEMWSVLQCESNGSTTIQSRHIRPDGTREQSFGLVQIFLPAHPDVTKDQALDPKFSIEFMAKHFAQGRQKMWSCWK